MEALIRQLAALGVRLTIFFQRLIDFLGRFVVLFGEGSAGSGGAAGAGMAYSLGNPDGEELQFEDLCTVVKQITSRLSIPLSVDFERGYGESVAAVKENAKRLIEAGAVGFNIEDGLSNGNLDESDFQLEKIESLVQLKEETGIPFVINARSCVYWLDVADTVSKIESHRNRECICQIRR